MSAIPVIPRRIATPQQLEDWAVAAALGTHGLADRLRLVVAVMDRAGEIGARMRAKRNTQGGT